MVNKFLALDDANKKTVEKDIDPIAKDAVRSIGVIYPINNITRGVEQTLTTTLSGNPPVDRVLFWAYGSVALEYA